MNHASRAPSSAEHWGNCSGQPLAVRHLPDLETEPARIGTATHWVCSEVLILVRDHGAPSDCRLFIGAIAPNGVVIDETMAEGAQEFVDEVLAVCRKYDALDRLLVEFRVYMPDIHPDNWGTLDACLYLPELGLLFIWDYKNGHGYVDAKENLQLIDYTKGVFNHYNVDGYTQQHLRVSIRVVQPFCYYVRGTTRIWDVLATDLRPFWNKLHNTAHETDHNPTLTTGPHCRYCKALGRCSATRQARYNFIELVQAPYEIDDMSPRDMAVELGILEVGIAIAKERKEAIELELIHRIRNGAPDSPLTIEAVPGRENWNVPHAQAKALFSSFGVDITTEGLLTPKQSLKKAPAAVRPMLEAILSKFTKVNNSVKLIPVPESRNARAFQKKTEQ